MIQPFHDCTVPRLIMYCFVPFITSISFSLIFSKNQRPFFFSTYQVTKMMQNNWMLCKKLHVIHGTPWTFLFHYGKAALKLLPRKFRAKRDAHAINSPQFFSLITWILAYKAIGRKNTFSRADWKRKFDVLISFQKGHGQRSSSRLKTPYILAQLLSLLRI